MSHTVLEKNSETSTHTWITPYYTIQEHSDALEARVEIPGCKQEDIQLHLEKNTLTMKAKRSHLTLEKWQTLQCETLRHNYQLNLKLHADINGGNILAKLKLGVLHLTLPKTESAKPREITIN